MNKALWNWKRQARLNKRTEPPCATSPIHARLSSFKSVTCESGTSRQVNEVWWDKSVFGTCCLQVTVRRRTVIMKRLSPWQRAHPSPWAHLYMEEKGKRKLHQPHSACSNCKQPFKLWVAASEHDVSVRRRSSSVQLPAPGPNLASSH